MGTCTEFYFPRTLWLIILSSSISTSATHVKTFGERLSDLGRDIVVKLARVVVKLLTLLSTSFPLTVAYKTEGDLLQRPWVALWRRWGVALGTEAHWDRKSQSTFISLMRPRPGCFPSIINRGWRGRMMSGGLVLRWEEGRKENHRVWEVVVVW